MEEENTDSLSSFTDVWRHNNDFFNIHLDFLNIQTPPTHNINSTSTFQQTKHVKLLSSIFLFGHSISHSQLYSASLKDIQYRDNFQPQQNINDLNTIQQENSISSIKTETPIQTETINTQQSSTNEQSSPSLKSNISQKDNILTKKESMPTTYTISAKDINILKYNSISEDNNFIKKNNISKDKYTPKDNILKDNNTSKENINLKENVNKKENFFSKDNLKDVNFVKKADNISLKENLKLKKEETSCELTEKIINKKQEIINQNEKKEDSTSKSDLIENDHINNSNGNSYLKNNNRDINTNEAIKIQDNLDNSIYQGISNNSTSLNQSNTNDNISLNQNYSNDTTYLNNLVNSISNIVVFMRGPNCRDLIVHTLINVCKEQPEFKQNLLTSIKMFITSFLTATNKHLSKAVHTLSNIFNVCLLLIPALIDFGTYLDLITEFCKLLPISSLPTIVEFLFNTQTITMQKYQNLEENSKNDKKKMQILGAKFVGLVKSLEERLTDTYLVSHIFTLRRLLIECLPLTHAGVTNKMSTYKEELINIKIDTEDSWIELTKWEAPNDITLFNTNLLANTSLNKQTDLSSPYSVFQAYVDLQNFLQQPQLILDKGQEYFKKTIESCYTILKYISKKPATTNNRLNVGEHVFTSNINTSAAFREAIDQVHFRKEFLCKLCIAFQTIYIPHKKDNIASNQDTQNTSVYTPSIFEKFDDKSKRLLYDLQNAVWRSISSFRYFKEEIHQMLIKESLWVNWKLMGCSDSVLTPHNNDTIESPPSINILTNLTKNIPKLDKYQKREQEALSNFLTFYDDWQSTIATNDINNNSNFPMIEKPNLLRDAQEWYLYKSNPYPSYDDEYLIQKFQHKLNDYRLKIKEDDDPINEIEEIEKSKYNSLFRFRLSKLFALNYLDAYTEMSNSDILAGKVDVLVKSMDAYDKLGPFDKKSSQKRKLISQVKNEDKQTTLDSSIHLNTQKHKETILIKSEIDLEEEIPSKKKKKSVDVEQNELENELIVDNLTQIIIDKTRNETLSLEEYNKNNNPENLENNLNNNIQKINVSNENINDKLNIKLGMDQTSEQTSVSSENIKNFESN